MPLVRCGLMLTGNVTKSRLRFEAIIAMLSVPNHYLEWPYGSFLLNHYATVINQHLISCAHYK